MLAHTPPGWSDVEAIFDALHGDDDFSIWGYAERACLSLGGTRHDVADVVAALFCAVASVRLVDDLLDEDPNGKHHQLGIGRTANLALALQAIGARILTSGCKNLSESRRVADAYARACTDTAFGQELDARGVFNEEEYWRQVEAKTPPLFARAFEMGALAAGADEDVVEALMRLGHVLAMAFQVSDDLADAYERPAKEDWLRPGSNLALLFASSVAHDERDAFVRLLPLVSGERALREAQAILTRSGAASYCAYKMLEFRTKIEAIFAELRLPNPAPLRELLDHCLDPLDALLQLGTEQLGRTD